ncbi:HET domain containing protein [Pyrenophora tritici-repentis]|nr:HET domain containing protein [Pyrenophora tritici-repentis]
MRLPARRLMQDERELEIFNSSIVYRVPHSVYCSHRRRRIYLSELCLGYNVFQNISKDTGKWESLPLDGVNQVIEDAIAVVIALGKRYLWVDQYYINQLDMDIKANQIREMDCVYAGAYVTIVACAGVDSDYGLSGISRERNLRLSATLPQLELVTSPPALSVAIRNTKWKTRGWTYQETVLSRRCLLFTDQQVYFACKNMSCCETDTDAGATSYSASHKIPMDLSRRIFHCEHQMAEDTNDLFDQIEEYSSRSLTHKEDALNAFRGLLNRSRFYTYYGIPIVPLNTESDQLGQLENMNL